MQDLLLHLHSFDHLHWVSSFWRFQLQISLMKLVVLISRHVSQSNPLLDPVSTCLMQSPLLLPLHYCSCLLAECCCMPSQLSCCPWIPPSNASASLWRRWMRSSASTAQARLVRNCTGLIHSASMTRLIRSFEATLWTLIQKLLVVEFNINPRYKLFASLKL